MRAVPKSRHFCLALLLVVSAMLQLPPGVVGSVQRHFAAAFVDLVTGLVVGTTNAVSLEVTP